MKSLLKVLTVLSLFYSTQSQSCQDFSEGLCPMDESNIVSSDLNIWSPDECQALCINENLCNFFSHVGSQCFLVDVCDTINECVGCISGPPRPSLSECQVSSSPAPTTTTTTTTTAFPTTTTTIPTTTTNIPMTTTRIPTTTTNIPTTTTIIPTTTITITSLPPCNVTEGQLCDAHENLIMEVDHLNGASDCQSLCQNHPECNYWSHWNEEGGEHWGKCQLHFHCDMTIDHECRDCYMRPGGRCGCMYGTPYPDLENCDDGTVHLPCEDDFFPGVLCDRRENEIMHLPGLATASDCQSLCQNHDECKFFSHTTRHEGECWLHFQCDNLQNNECWEDDCVAGPKYPDIDDCSMPEMH